MAVRHGYGKIAGTDALVFAYDTGDTRNSYRGEPTVNLLPNGVAAGHNSGAYGNVVTVTDATVEKGPGWKKVTISNRGSNFRIIQWTYLSMSANIMYCHSAVFDWGNMRDKGYYINHDGSGTGQRFFYKPGDYTTNQGSSISINSTLADGKIAGNITHTASHTHAFFINNNTTGVSGLNDYFYYKEFQVEANSHPTPYTTGTRSATQGLLDLTGNSTIDLSNVSFDSNAQIAFDGTDDRINIPDPNYPSSGTDAFTLETVFKIPNGAQWYVNGSGTGIIGRGSYGGSIGIIRSSTDNRVAFWVRLDGGDIFDPAIINLPRDVYNHVVGVYDGLGSAKIYHNGVFVAEETAATTGTLDTGTYNIGGGNSFGGNYGAFGEADIPVAKLYNRALTADEVRNNYRHYKNRFNIS